MKPASVAIRPVQVPDREAWVALRSRLWPQDLEEHSAAVHGFFEGESPWIDAGWVATCEKEVVGFLELRVRPYAAGSTKERVPYVEGWYVSPEFRGKGVGAKLVDACTEWAQSQGFEELASDAELANTASQAAHRALGFEEVERSVAFLKKLT